MSKMSIKTFDFEEFPKKVLVKCQFSRKFYCIMNSAKILTQKCQEKN